MTSGKKEIAMQCSTHCKKYEDLSRPNRNTKGKRKPVALKNAKKRLKNIKSKYCQ